MDKKPHANTTHGHTIGRHLTPEFISWCKMNDRCRNTRATQFRHYGGRGIQVCEAWRESFAAFLADVGPRPSRTHSLDRIDNDGHYEPGNVRWATKAEQAINQRTNRLITYRGETKPLAVWARERGLNYQALHARLNSHGWTIDRALSTPMLRQHH